MKYHFIGWTEGPLIKGLTLTYKFHIFDPMHDGCGKNLNHAGSIVLCIVHLIYLRRKGRIFLSCLLYYVPHSEGSLRLLTVEATISNTMFYWGQMGQNW